MARINDSSAKLLRVQQARAWQRGSLWAKGLFSNPGNPGLLDAIRRADSITDPEFRSRAQQAVLLHYCHKNRDEEATNLIAGFFLMKASLRMSHEYFLAFRRRMAWSNSHSQLIDALMITEVKDSGEAQLNSNPISSKDYRDQPQRTIDVLLHRITPANAPSAHRVVRVKV
jgi:hypothetical protein